MKRKERDRILGRDQTVAIEIVNNTGETKHVKFLGYQHRHFMEKGVTIRNIFNDTLYDDGELTQLINMIMVSPLFFKGINPEKARAGSGSR